MFPIPTNTEEFITLRWKLTKQLSTLQVCGVHVVRIIGNLQLLTYPHLSFVTVSLKELVGVGRLQLLSSASRRVRQSVSSLIQRNSSLRYVWSSVVLIAHQALQHHVGRTLTIKNDYSILFNQCIIL